MRMLLGLVILSVMVILPVVILPISAQSAIVARTWGGRFDDEGYGIATDSFGNSFLTGYTQGFGITNPGNISVFILKYNANGSLGWQRTWGGIGIDMGRGIAVNSSGDIYITGNSGSYGGVFLLKLNSSGDLLWQRTWGSRGGGNAVALDSMGDVYVAGVSYSSGATAGDALLLKISSVGELLWRRAWGGGNITQQANGVSVDGLGNVYVTGAGFGGSYSGANAFLLKVDSSGSLLWEKAWGSRNDAAYAVAANAAGSVYVTGGSDEVGQGLKIILLKFDPSGNLTWEKTWGGNGNEVGSAIALDSEGGIYITGNTNSFNVGTQDVVLLKFDSHGNILDQETWGVSQNDFGADIGTAIAIDSAGNAVATGFVDGGAPYTLTARNGTVRTSNLLVSSTNNTLTPPTVNLTAQTGRLITALGNQSYAGGPDVFFLKYDPPAIGLSPSTVFPSTMLFGTLLATPLLILRRRCHNSN